MGSAFWHTSLAGLKCHKWFWICVKEGPLLFSQSGRVNWNSTGQMKASIENTWLALGFENKSWHHNHRKWLFLIGQQEQLFWGMTFGTVSQIIESSLLCRGWAWQKVTLYVDDRWRPKWGVCMKMPKNNCRQLPDFLLMFGPLLCQYLFFKKNEDRQFQI